jgi:hypothetical protein
MMSRIRKDRSIFNGSRKTNLCTWGEDDPASSGPSPIARSGRGGSGGRWVVQREVPFRLYTPERK